MKIKNRRIYDLMCFGVAVTQTDCPAPQSGNRRLKDFFAEAAGNN